MFIVENEYPRDDLLAFLGSRQKQTGIIWGDKHPDSVIVTSGGRHSKRAGYEDAKNNDGSWIYFGQGEKGNHNPNSFANKILIKGEKSVLLFSTREPNSREITESGSYAKKYKYEGCFGVMEWSYFTPTEGPRAGDKLLKFNMAPVRAGLMTGLSFGDNVFEQGGVNKNRSLYEYYLRSDEVKAMALARASGICECCLQPAPFMTMGGKSYLEVHHILRLADDGPDKLENVVAICPNCHRESHHGVDANELRAKFLSNKILSVC